MNSSVRIRRWRWLTVRQMILVSDVVLPVLDVVPVLTPIKLTQHCIAIFPKRKKRKKIRNPMTHRQLPTLLEIQRRSETWLRRRVVSLLPIPQILCLHPRSHQSRRQSYRQPRLPTMTILRKFSSRRKMLIEWQRYSLVNGTGVELRSPVFLWEPVVCFFQ